MSKLKTYSNLKHLELNERYTQSRYIEAARAVMGYIHLDPASCYFANLVVKADVYYDRHSDGLRKDWEGNVWMNPPFSGNLGSWIYKLVHSYKVGAVHQAIVLYPAASGVFSTGWLHMLLEYPLCIPRKRICYYQEGTASIDHPPFSSLFTYMGPNTEKFAQVFKRYGDVMVKV